jgi:type III protein arginine methyltransferase
VCSGLLTSGLLPALRHTQQQLLTADAIIIPSAVTVYAQAVQATTHLHPDGVDLSALDPLRWALRLGVHGSA